MTNAQKVIFEPTWESLQQFEIPEWYKDAKFGIFIHWGLYSVPAYDNEWYSRNMYLQGDEAYEYHRKTFGSQEDFGYKDFIPMFTAEKFDAAAWAKLFKESGAKYVVPVAEHHDGFPMYDSKLTRWTAVKMGPKRDITGELRQAITDEGMVFGASSHRAEHWWFMNGGMEFPSDVQDPEYADFYGPAKPSPRKWYSEGYDSKNWQPRPDEAFLKDWLARCCEIVDQYRPQIFYFDWWIEQEVFEPYLKDFAAYYYNRGQEWGIPVSINCKNGAYPEGTVVFDIERGRLSDIRPTLWQTDTSVSNNSWCYIQNHEYKSTTEILHTLVDIVSKNGTLLLNIGPKADGTIPEREQEMLREIGAWLATNGEAIYGTRPWSIYGEGPTEIAEGQFTEGKQEGYTAEDIRFTTQGDTLYAIVMGKPENGEIRIETLRAGSDHYPQEIATITHVGSGKPVEWERGENSLTIKAAVEDIANVFKIEQA